jgi:hypothetical protein
VALLICGFVGVAVVWTIVSDMLPDVSTPNTQRRSGYAPNDPPAKTKVPADVADMLCVDRYAGDVCELCGRGSAVCIRQLAVANSLRTSPDPEAVRLCGELFKDLFRRVNAGHSARQICATLNDAAQNAW